MELLKGANAVLAFALEIAMYASYGVWGYALGNNTIIRWSAALGIPAIIVGIWALFAAPNANYRLHQPVLYFLELGLMVIAAILLYKLGHHSWALIFAALAITSQTIALALKQ